MKNILVILFLVPFAYSFCNSTDDYGAGTDELLKQAATKGSCKDNYGSYEDYCDDAAVMEYYCGQNEKGEPVCLKHKNWCNYLGYDDCQAGGCISTKACADECTKGELICTKLKSGYYECGNYDGDPCAEEGNFHACAPGELCEDGKCAESDACVNVCDKTGIYCEGNNVWECFTVSGCLRNREVEKCEGTCEDGACIAYDRTGQCKEWDRKCTGNNVYACMPDGPGYSWQIEEECPRGMECVYNQCVDQDVLYSLGETCQKDDLNDCEDSVWKLSGHFVQLTDIDKAKNTVEVWGWSASNKFRVPYIDFHASVVEFEKMGKYTIKINEGAGSISITEPCTSQCDDGARCNKDSIEICKDDDKDGCKEWVSSVDCPSGQKCIEGACKANCIISCDLGRRCNGNGVLECNVDENGCKKEVLIEDCKACKDGVCIECADCQAGEKKCEDGKVYVCSGECAEWTVIEECPLGCENAKCRQVPPSESAPVSDNSGEKAISQPEGDVPIKQIDDELPKIKQKSSVGRFFCRIFSVFGAKC